LIGLEALSPAQLVGLFVIGAIGSGINSVAGGGTLLTFPFLTQGIGLSASVANATNAVSLWPGSLGGVLGLRSEYAATQSSLRQLALVTFLGGATGAALFLGTSERVFRQLVPILILFAALLLFFQPQVRKAFADRDRTIPVAGGMAIQFAVAVYGGYFGAGMGIMMLAAFSLFVPGNTHQINFLKNALGVLINFSASVYFVAKGAVNLPVALVLAVGAVVGGYAAATLSLKLDPNRLRTGVAIYGVLVAAYYAWQVFGIRG
jgi:hypothetical protein